MLKESLLKDQSKSESHPISAFLGFQTSDPFRFASPSGGLVQKKWDIFVSRSCFLYNLPSIISPFFGVSVGFLLDQKIQHPIEI